MQRGIKAIYNAARNKDCIMQRGIKQLIVKFLYFSDPYPTILFNRRIFALFEKFEKLLRKCVFYCFPKFKKNHEN